MNDGGHDGWQPHDPDADLLHLAGTLRAGRLARFAKGSILHWQGDPVEAIYIVRSGAVKVCTTSPQGRTYTYDILGAGGLDGAATYLLGKHHETQAVALEDTEVITLLPDEFDRLLAGNPRFSLLVMRYLAQGTASLAGKVRELGFLDVQQRLKHRLLELARRHGIATPDGVRIDLDITHEEMGALVAANRTTITACISELKKQGYLWSEGRHLVMVPPQHVEILDSLSQAVLDGDEVAARRWAGAAVAHGVDAIKALEALSSGMRRVDGLFSRDELQVSDVILAAFAMKSAMPIIDAEIERTGQVVGYLGTVVIGTVYGDIHDIGQTMVAMLLRARGFAVIDLGANVPAERFAAAVARHRPGILAMSSLMTTTTQELSKVIDTLAREGLRGGVKVMVGGSAVTRRMGTQMGADGYEPSAHGAAELAWRLMNPKH
ncbi:MAG TPA: cobalamin-dependent protein [Anaerolineae bacterium]|nr:cobalamin-dependent protein [Anaerolineae bacterium]HOQ97579.1 cobalamin-dependent protein [Anaerolineae bacterium]HPL28398.1 cobalamin-dependent protein [Anaerolineae bacterium]